MIAAASGLSTAGLLGLCIAAGGAGLILCWAIFKGGRAALKNVPAGPDYNPCFRPGQQGSPTEPPSIIEVGDGWSGVRFAATDRGACFDVIPATPRQISVLCWCYD